MDTMKAIKEQRTPLFLGRLADAKESCNPVLPAEGRERLLAAYPAAAGLFFPYVDLEALGGGAQKYCLFLPACEDAALRRQLELASEGCEKSFCSLVRTEPGALLTVLGQRFTGAVPVKLYRESVAVGEVACAAPQSSLLQYGLLQSRMFYAWACAFSRYRVVYNLYRYAYNAFPTPEAPDAGLCGGIAGAAVKGKLTELNELADALYGGPFPSDRDRVQRLLELFSREKRAGKAGRKQEKGEGK